MDMTENEDKLIEKLFQEAAQLQIADDGFTERVMERLPQNRVSTQWLSRLWTLFCVVTAVVLFFLLDGWESLKNSLWYLVETGLTWLSVVVTTAPTADLHLDPVLVLLLLVFVLVVLPYQTVRKLSTAL